MSNLIKKLVAVLTGLTVVVMSFPMMTVSSVNAMTAEELQAQIAQLQQQLAQLQSQLSSLQGGTTGGAIAGIPAGFTFTKSLSLGSKGDDVKYLQIVLNSDSDTQLAASGVGSSGNETTYFGPLTKAAVIKFQEKYADEVLAPIGLSKGTGFVGSKTIAKLNALLSASAGTTGGETAEYGTAFTFTLSGAPVAGDYVYITLTDAENVVKCSADVLSAPAGVTLDGLTDTLTTKFNNCANFSASSEGNVITVVTTGTACKPKVDVDNKSGSTLNIVGAITEAAGSETGGETGATTPVAAGLTVGLASNTPASTLLIDTQSLADIVKFTFVNGDASDVKVTQLKVKRTGISSDTNLPNLYLYDGSTRLTDNTSLVNHYALFNNPDGLFVIPAGGSKTITVKADVSGSSGIVALEIESASDIVSDASAVNGTFPISGNSMTMTSAPANLATVSLGAVGSDLGPVDPGTNGFAVWQNTITVTQDAQFKYIRLREIGSITKTDLQNFRLYIDDSQVGSAVEMDNSYYVTFDTTDSPVALESGEHTIVVKADVIDGSTRSFSFSLRRASDMIITDSQYNVNVAASGTLPSTVDPSIVISAGRLTVALASDSPSESVIKGTKAAVLAKYTLKAYGEKVKVESLKFNWDSSTAAPVPLTNVKLYAGDTLIGNIVPTLYEKDDSTSGHTPTSADYNLGSSLIVTPGAPVTLAIKADVPKTGTVPDDITVKMIEGSGNAQALTSLGSISVPATDKPANQLDVKTGSLVISKNSAYGNQNTVKGTTGVKIGSFILTPSDEAIHVTKFKVRLTWSDTGSATTAIANAFSNLYVKYGSSQTEPKDPVKTTNEFAVDTTLSGSQMVVEVYADVNNVNGVDTDDSIEAGLQVTYTKPSSGTVLQYYPSNTTYVDGQTITVKAGSLSVSLSPSTPEAGIVVATKTDVPVATYKFTASNANVTLKDITLKLVDPTYVSNIKDVKLSAGGVTSPAVYLVLADYTTGTATSSGAHIKVGTTTAATFSVDDKIVVTYGTNSTTTQITGFATTSDAGDSLVVNPVITGVSNGTQVTIKSYGVTFPGVNLTVSKDTPLEVSVLVDLNNVTTDGTDGANVQIALAHCKYNVGGQDKTLLAKSPQAFTGLHAKAMTVYRTVPTVTLASDSPSGAGTLAAGAKTTVAKINISADSAYEVKVNYIQFTPTLSKDAGVGDGIYVYDGTTLKGSALNQGETLASISTTTAGSDITVADSSIYQIGELLDFDLATDTDVQDAEITAIPSSTAIRVSKAIDTPSGAQSCTIKAAGYTSGHAYKVALTNAVISAGGSKTYTVKADLTGLTNTTDYARFDIAAAGDFNWDDGTTHSIDGTSISTIPLTGGTLRP
ncbi:peptidoglycan-binding protein [bacterium]|nr:peptidoglycan-binding protein [bacterium]